MEQIDYAEMLPLQPPEGMTEFLMNNGYLKEEYIVYEGAYVKEPLTGERRSMVKCKCSACGEVSYCERVSSGVCSHAYAPAPFGFLHPELGEAVIANENTLCPVCGAQVKAVHTGQLYHGERLMECVYPIEIRNIGGYLVVIEWQARNSIFKNGTRTIEYRPSEAAIFEKRKIVRCNAIRQYFNGCFYLGGWEQRVKYADEIGNKDKSLIFPFEPEVLNGTYAENSKLDIYVRDCKKPMIVAYLKLWQIHKNVENVVTQGASEYVTEAIAETANKYTRNHNRAIAKNTKGFIWNEVKPHRMLGVTKEEFRSIVKNGLTLNEVEFYKKYREHIEISDTRAAAEMREWRCEKIIKMEQSIPKVIRYINTQKKRYKERASDIDVSMVTDYWDMISEEGISLKEAAYPKYIIKAHDEAVKRKKWKEQEALRPLFAKRAEELSRFSFSDGRLEIHPARTETEMIEEGKILHHCVARYAKDHANGRTAIFFIRHTSEPELPYFTLELDEEMLLVRQNRGKHNCERTEEVIIFEKKWLKFIEEVHNNVRNNRSKVS